MKYETAKELIELIYDVHSEVIRLQSINEIRSEHTPDCPFAKSENKSITLILEKLDVLKSELIAEKDEQFEIELQEKIDAAVSKLTCESEDSI